MAEYVLGYRGMAWHVDTYTDHGLRWLHRLAAAGGGMVLVGVLVFVVSVLAATLRRHDAAGDPYGGLTLEWATTSPPPRQNFETLPEVRSAQPLADLRGGRSAAPEGATA